MRRRLSLLLLAFCCPALIAADDKPAPWAFRKPVRADLPHISDAHWAKNPLDAFILARLDCFPLLVNIVGFGGGVPPRFDGGHFFGRIYHEYFVSEQVMYYT